jgi:hypothetical protein
LRYVALQHNLRSVPMTIENQIINFLYSRRGHVLCHRCLRRAAVLPDLPEIELALGAIGRAARFLCGEAECSECRQPRQVIGAV